MVDRAKLPSVIVAQMREVDRIAVGELGASVLQMMENAGRALAELTRIHLGGLSRPKADVLAGRGGNGGGGMAVTRRLTIWGRQNAGRSRPPRARPARRAGAHGTPDPRLLPSFGPGSRQQCAHEATIRAARTLALALPKAGQLLPEAADCVGELWLADIAVPPQAVARFGLDTSALFGGTDVIPLPSN